MKGIIVVDHVGEAFTRLVEFTGRTPAELTQQLYQSHSVGLTWCIFAAVGVLSAVMIFFYGRWISKLARREVGAQQS